MHEGEFESRPGRGLHVYAVATAVATLLLITAGGLVTSTGSGLAVPDWPLSYGMVFPPMVGGILYEHGHRMVATAVGLLTIVLALWLWRRESRRWVRRLGFAALAAVIVQGLLGGITVLFLLPLPVSVAHACIAQAFLCLTVAIAVVTSRAWRQAGTAGPAAPASPRLFGLAVATTAAIYLQLILGALTRHTQAGLAIPDFPLANGRLIPLFTSPLVMIQFAHRLGALLVAALVLATVVRVQSERPPARAITWPAVLLPVLLVAQIALGAATVWTRLAVLPSTAHVTAGAALLATSLVLALMSGRHARLAAPALARPAGAFVSRPATAEP